MPLSRVRPMPLSPAPTPAPGATSAGSAGAGSAESAGGGTSGSAGGERPSREFPERVTIHWATWSQVGGAYASGFAFAAASLDRPRMEPDRMSEGDLLESVTQLGAVEQHKEVNLVRLMGEVEARGVASPGGLSRVDWLRQVDPTLTASAARAVVTCAAAFNQPRRAQLREAVTGETVNPESPGEHRGANGEGDGAKPAARARGVGADRTGADAAGGGSGSTCSGSSAERVTVGKAAQVIDFHTRLKPVADPDDLEQAVTHLTEQASGLRWEQLAKLARELSDQVRPPKNTDDHDQRRRNSRGLWFTGPNAAGMVGMSGTLDPEGAATLKSAIDPLSAPCPLTDEAGVRIEDDPRPAHQRRMDALLDLVARGVTSPGEVPTTDKAKIVVTIDLETLRDWMRNGCPPDWATRSGQGETHTNTHTNPNTTGPHASAGSRTRGGGSCQSGDVLTAASVRRMACDAAIIPVILGSDSQPLDVGRQERLVTRAMRTALWLRDQGCSFPGCSMPAQWTDAHHVRHWLHGGETKVSNLALLCRRHHVYVHDKNLTATITDTGVTWDTWQEWRTSFTVRC